MKKSIVNILCLVTALYAAGAVQSGDMYKWQDEDGIWHYSDESQKRSNVWVYVSRIERGRGGMENTFAWLSKIRT